MSSNRKGAVRHCLQISFQTSIALRMQGFIIHGTEALHVDGFVFLAMSKSVALIAHASAEIGFGQQTRQRGGESLTVAGRKQQAIDAVFNQQRDAADICPKSPAPRQA